MSGDEDRDAAVGVLTRFLFAPFDAAGADDVASDLVRHAAARRGITGAALVMMSPTETLDVMAVSGPVASALSAMQLASGTGPLVECLRAGQRVDVRDVRTSRLGTRAFAEEAQTSGIRGVTAIPLQDHAAAGVLVLYRSAPAADSRDDADLTMLGRAAVTAVLQRRDYTAVVDARDQLQHALESRVVIEQAKGMTAARHGIDVDAAFALIRRHARSASIPLIDVARRIVDDDLRV